METGFTPLHEEHVSLKALMAPFAGWDMPIHYGSILDEARHTRSAVSVFDISHMGEFIVKERPGSSSLDHAITTPVLAMKNGRCKYGFLLNERGGIIDDLITYRLSDDEWMIVVNASNEKRDFETISGRLSSDAKIENISARIVKLDVQGPKSMEVLAGIAGPGIKKLTYYGFGHFEFMGGRHIISRTGYTGELGFEVYVDPDTGVKLWKELLRHPAVTPAGLGARDILRLEMGLPLYGNEFTEDTSPIDGGMERFLDMNKSFAGKEALVKQQKTGTARRLVGFIADGRRSPRHENRIVEGGKDSGHVTSGVFSPHLNCGIGMGYIDAARAGIGTAIAIDTGRGEIAAKIDPVPFIKQTSIKYTEA
jgi:aminomethyltransferase